MRRVGLLISRIRRDSGNENEDSMTSDDIASYINDGQSRIQAGLVEQFSNVFVKEGFLDSVKDQVVYTLPSDVYGDSRIITIENNIQTNDVNGDGYYPLRKITPVERQRFDGYFIRGNQLVLATRPTRAVTNGIRINYVKRLPTLGRRIGEVSSLSPLTITGFDVSSFESDYCSIVDFDGTQTQVNIKVTGFNTGTGVITTPTTISGPSVGDFVVYGKNSSTHSELPEEAETFLIEYGSLRTIHKNSSVDLVGQSTLLQDLLETIKEAMSANDQDVTDIPINNPDLMVY